MAFWGTNLDAGSRDPKRKFRFKVEFQQLGGGNVLWYAKGVGKPSMSISADTAHKFLGHTFKYPGSVTWEDIELTLVDPAEDGEGGEDAAMKLLSIVEASGYKFPKGTDILETISKGKATEAIEKVVIHQLDASGQNTVERWTLHNPFINKLSFGDLSYEDDGLSEITVGVTFDWAEFSKGASTDSKFFEQS